MSATELNGWERLRHGGLLLDPARSRRFAEEVRPPVGAHNERELRKHLAALPETRADVTAFARFVLEELCGFTNGNGRWTRGADVDPSLTRRGLGGESIKPNWLWIGADEGRLPVFFDSEARIGIGRGRKAASQVVQWLRAGTDRLALLTNGREWRLVYGALDADAWCEWDADLWLEEGQLSSQVACLRTLLSPRLWTPEGKGTHPPLVQAVLDSRKGQAELSAALGERVREAVELIVQAHGEPLKTDCAGVESSLIYRAAVRMVMRMVVVLFAESRDLLPRDNAFYFGSYGLGGLLADLEKAGARGLSRLGRSHNAWPRVLALFRLVHEGSHHPALPVPAYGGELFAPGDSSSIDGLQKSIGVFETACFDQELVSDREVLQMLQRLTRTQVRVRQGNTSTTITAPVDFSDLSSEYIGILYEGLLDFELKTAPSDDPVVFLGIGNQPALPLSRLDQMDDKALASLLEKMKDTSSSSGADDDEDEEDEAAEEAADDTGGAEGDERPGELSENADDKRQVARTRAEVWARRAVEAGKLVRKPRVPITAVKTAQYEAEVAAKSRQLVTRVVLGGEWFLVRWGGTRKGSGTFYTRPGLAVPTVQRTLRPLAYDPPVGADGTPDSNAPVAEWTPKTPEQILSVKACDPACGSGTFPVAALRFLTDALHAAHHHHQTDAAREPDDVRFRALLRRQVVERCIYGVDLDPLAVELCRLALWIETMDRTLPFSFLDHKIKAGNSLVGAWFDTYQHYPAMAWKERDALNREKDIKKFNSSMVKPDLADLLSGRTAMFEGPSEDPLTIHAEAMAGLEEIHRLPEHESAERAKRYKALRSSAAFLTLKEAMDLWCACWFWPLDRLDHAPLPTTIGDPSEEVAATLVEVQARKQFFHWELEFPDVFGPDRGGFDAILGNPPWDVAKPNSKEFFSNLDPLYRSYGKQEALAYQAKYFEDAGVAREWELYNDDFKAQSNFVGHSANPFGDPDAGDSYAVATGARNVEMHREWRHRRRASRGYADAAHPFRHQGSADVNLYKMFVEQAQALLRQGGRLGFIVPSGLYSDFGTQQLRRLLLDSCRWEWLFNFINWELIFPSIYYRFKFNVLIVEKGGQTDAVQTAFVRTKLEDWETAESIATRYSREQVDRFSPKSKAILEIESPRDLGILEKIYKNSVLLGDDGPDGWGITYSREFDMTNDSKLFPPRPVWEAQGYRPDEYSRWLKGNWRPIAELWPELKIDPAKVVPIDPECERRMAEPDVQRTPWRVRCAQPPYDSLPIPRAEIPAGVILSRDGQMWIQKEQIAEVTFTTAAGAPLSIKFGRGKKAVDVSATGPAIANPLYEGRMIAQFDFGAKAWVSGSGRSARWDSIGWGEKSVGPQFLMGTQVQRLVEAAAHLESIRLQQGEDAFEEELLALQRNPVGKCQPSGPRDRVVFMDVTSATNARTAVAAVVGQQPCGNSLPSLTARVPAPLLAAMLNSLAHDYVARARCVGLHLNWFVIAESVLPVRTSEYAEALTRVSLRLGCGNPAFAAAWKPGVQPWRAAWALTAAARSHLRVRLEVVCAALYGLDSSDLDHIFSGCDLPLGGVGSAATQSPRGFWRVDNDLEPERRLPNLVSAAVRQLEARTQGRDLLELAADQLLADTEDGDDGPRFLDWQWAQDAAESWRECEIHAANLR